MDRLDIMSRIRELERGIATLPPGSVVAKIIKGKEYYYHRVTRNGKRTETYVDFGEVDELRSRIAERKGMEAELKRLRMFAPLPERRKGEKGMHRFSTDVSTGSKLERFIAPVRGYKRRGCYAALHSYVFGESRRDEVFILCGLRRTGKTTLMLQALSDMPPEQLAASAYIRIRKGDTLFDVDDDLRYLEDHGCKYVFIDEATRMDDFIEGASLFSDIYAARGMKVVLSGTDSLGFVLASHEQLYDRCRLLRTTHIPYREFEAVLGIRGIDEYIKYGGTMSPGGVDYNGKLPFSDAGSAGEYVDTAIARNIQHSLEHYEDGGHFRRLRELYRKDELTSAINRVVENENHEFAKKVLTKRFRSGDLHRTARNLLKDRQAPVRFLDDIDEAGVTEYVKGMLDILDAEEQTVEVDDVCAYQIKEYLEMLDLIEEIDDIEYPHIGDVQKMTVLAQPGLRYAQAEALIGGLLRDKRFDGFSAELRERILERIMTDIEGGMMEGIVQLETKHANPDKHVFKLQFAAGEFDMVVQDRKALTCDIFEVKHSKEAVGGPDGQCRHLINADKCAKTEHSFGRITGKYVIYRGETAESDGVRYLNVEEYLKSLGDTDGGYGYLHGDKGALVSGKAVAGPEPRRDASAVFAGGEPVRLEGVDAENIKNTKAELPDGSGCLMMVSIPDPDSVPFRGRKSGYGCFYVRPDEVSYAGDGRTADIQLGEAGGLVRDYRIRSAEGQFVSYPRTAAQVKTLYDAVRGAREAGKVSGKEKEDQLGG